MFMQGIKAKDHERMIEAFEKFKELASVIPLPTEQRSGVCEGINELTELYVSFCRLFSELDQCAKNYETRRKVVQTMMYKNIRKMNTQIRRR